MPGRKPSLYEAGPGRWTGKHYVQMDPVPLGCFLVVGVLGSMPTCAHGSPEGENPASVLVSLGLLVVLACGLLFVLASLAS